MSRSYSQASHNSRGSRSRGQSNISVTEASFQNLQLQETAGSHHTSASSTYNPQDPRYSGAAHHRGETASSYLQAGFDTSSFGPSETYIDPSRLTTTFTPSSDTLDFLNPQSSAYSRADMPYSYAHDPYPRSPYLSSRSPSVPAYTYSGAEATPQRSMSGSSGPTILPSSAPGRLSPSEHGMVRQRRRDSQHSRRSNKLRFRRTALPSISEARPSVAPDMSQSIDFVVASTTASPYSLPSAYDPPYHRNQSIPPNYLPSSSSPYVSSNYNYGTGLGGQVYSQGSSHSSSQGGSRRTSTAPSVSPNTAEGPIRVLESRSRPQCWDHGCNGRQFSTFSNLLRHQREKSGTATKSYCPRCGAEFTRTTARNGHVQEGKCSKQDRRKSPADR